jgi:hypothetical protein
VDVVTVGFLIFLVVAALVILTVVVHAAKKRNMARRAAFIAAFRFPPGLDRALAARRPTLDSQQRKLVLEALRQYFLVVLTARHGRIAKRLGLPSKAADEAWQEFVAMTGEYQAFCQQAFGKVLRHRPSAPLDGASEDAFANTLHQLRRNPPGGVAWAALAGVPLLFALDRNLALADGHVVDAAGMEGLEARRLSLVAASGGSTFVSSGEDDEFESDASSDGGSEGGSDGGGGDGGGGGGGDS